LNKQMFENPSAVYRPQPFWFLNHEFSQEELLRQITEMSDKGVGGVVLHSRHGKKTDYLSHPYLEMLEFCVEECRKREMVVWLYDEDNWPSGTFGGKLTQSHPEYRMRYLRVEEKSVQKANSAQPIQLDFAQKEHNELIAVLAYRVEQSKPTVVLEENPIELTDRIDDAWVPPDETEYIILAFWECEIDEKVTFGGGYYLDTMNVDAVNAFIKLAYDPFLFLKQHFGNSIKGVFTDEPGLMIHDGFFGVEAIRTEVKQLNANLPGVIFAWTRNMLDRYKAELGYDLKPLLGALLYQVGDQSTLIREHYYKKITDWYVDAYHRALQSWCHSNDLKYIGHTLEEPLWGQARSQGNQTRVLQQFDYPGLDYLTPGIGSKDNPHRILSVKCAASVADLEGKQRVICEAFGASDHGYSMRQRRKDANFMAFLGVNLFIPHAFYYSFEGYRKTDFPPTEFYHAPHWEHYRSFADYIGRLSLLGSLGHHKADILMVSPVHTVYQEMFENGKASRKPESDLLFSMLSDRLLRNRLDYDYADECQLENSNVSEAGKLTFAESKEAFQTIVLPGMSYLSRKTAEKLFSFVRAGGSLIIVGEIPVNSHESCDDPEIQETFTKLIPTKEYGVWQTCGKGKSVYLPVDKIQADDAAQLCTLIHESLEDSELDSWKIPSKHQEDIILKRRIIDRKTFTWVMNWSDQNATISYRANPQEAVKEWNLETGKVETLTEEEMRNFTVISGQLRIITSDYTNVERSAETNRLTQAKELRQSWRFQPDEPNVFILDKWEVTLNDRQSRMNATMPGQVNTYRTRFKVDDALWTSLNKCSNDANPPHEMIRLIIDDLEQEIPSHIGFLSRRRNVEIYVNGHQLPALSPSAWQDRFYKSVDLTSYIELGENEIEILMVSLLEPMSGLHFPAFLVGEFSTDLKGNLSAPRKNIAGNWVEAGYPYFSGKASYSQSFQVNFDSNGLLEKQDRNSAWLAAEDIKETASLWVNGTSIGTKLWPPYQWDITDAVHEGENELRIQTANTLENLYGKNPVPSGVIGKVRVIIKSKEAQK
jgi:hypothetical protein